MLKKNFPHHTTTLLSRSSLLIGALNPLVRKVCLFLLLTLAIPMVANGAKEESLPLKNALSVPFPRPLDTYQDGHLSGMFEVLQQRIQAEPFNLLVTFLFFGAIIHTFFAGYFNKKAHQLERKSFQKTAHKDSEKDQNPALKSNPKTHFWVTVLHFLGEVEAIFGIWSLPLCLAIIWKWDASTLTAYLNHHLQFSEPIFVVVIMALASTTPVVNFGESILRIFARLGRESVKAWWMSILMIGPLLGSLITEPAAMTLSAILLARQFYTYSPSNYLKYGTLGLLFVNISIGGTLTHFAAPPILMVAQRWGWDLPFVFKHFGAEALLSIVCSTLLYAFIFRKEFAHLQKKAREHQRLHPRTQQATIPAWITIVHLLFMVFMVVSLHQIILMIGGFLFFLAFHEATQHHQGPLHLRGPLLVGFFLAGLVIHGGLQSWWLEPVLGRLNPLALFGGATLLTAFNDNAAITYLASQVPTFAQNPILQHAVVAGAVTGGGLTVIANAPNPAGQALLRKFFHPSQGISPLKLLASAVVPTLIAALWFNLMG